MPHDPPPNPDADFRPNTSHSAHSVPPVAPVQAGSPLQSVLPWIFSAAAVLGLMLVMLFLVLPRLSQTPAHSRPLPAPSDAAALLPLKDTAPPLVPAQPPAAKAAEAQQVPLSVTLYSAGSGKHVPVGKPVLISAYAVLPPAASATIAISYTRNGGPRSLLTLAQGSLSTASWAPALPGRYAFTASALDTRKISVFSRSLVIVADAKPAPPLIPALPPVRIAVPAQVPHVKTAPRRLPARIVPAARPAPMKRGVSRQPSASRKPSVPTRPRVPKPHLKPYHVAAASFLVRPIAETLAGALRRRGFHAFVQVVKQPRHKPMYAVETGDYLQSTEAAKQAAALKHDGYPAFISH